jgi:hypothetical protein
LNDPVVVNDDSMWSNEVHKINGIKGIITKMANGNGFCIITYRKGKRGKIRSIEVHQANLLYAPTREKFNFEF